MSRLIPENPYTSTGWHSRQKKRCAGWRLSFFSIISKERKESVSLKSFIKELAEQEGCRPQEISAILLREYRKEFPEYEPFGFYYHDLVNSFVTVGKQHCSGLLAHCTVIDNFEEAEFFYPVENRATGLMDMREIVVKAPEIGMFLMSVGTGMPECIKHVRKEVMDTFSRRNAIQYSRPLSVDEPDNTHEWEKFRGRDTALTLISGLSMALCKGHANCTINGRPNKSAIANVATNALIDAGFLSEMVSDRQIRTLLSSALKQVDFQENEG